MGKSFYRFGLLFFLMGAQTWAGALPRGESEEVAHRGQLKTKLTRVASLLAALVISSVDVRTPSIEEEQAQIGVEQFEPKKDLDFAIHRNQAGTRDIYIGHNGVEQLNKMALRPGDRVLLRSGTPIMGTIKLSAKDRGTAEKPIVIESFPANTRATLLATLGHGIEARDVSGVRIQNVDIVGRLSPDLPKSLGNGVYFESTQRNYDEPERGHITLSGLRISGFTGDHSGAVKAGNGILITSSGKGQAYHHVLIENSQAFENDHAGVLTESANNQYHQDVTIRNVQAYRNSGLAESKENSGSGIVLGFVDGGLIEFCKAYENGAKNLRVGGPVGIWAWFSKNIIIRKNQSFRNRTGSTADGGGFDLDGSVTNSILEDNESWDNEGAGYLLCTFQGSGPVKDVIVRRNKSHNDGLKNSYGAFVAFGDIQDALIENNDFVVKPSADGVPNAIKLYYWKGHGLTFKNNRIAIQPGADFLNFEHVKPELARGLTFTGNQLSALDGTTGGNESLPVRINEDRVPLQQWAETNGFSESLSLTP